MEEVSTCVSTKEVSIISGSFLAIYILFPTHRNSLLTVSKAKKKSKVTDLNHSHSRQFKIHTNVPLYCQWRTKFWGVIHRQNQRVRQENPTSSTKIQPQCNQARKMAMKLGSTKTILLAIVEEGILMLGTGSHATEKSAKYCGTTLSVRV